MKLSSESNCILFLINLIAVLLPAVSAINGERKLLEKLFENYTTEARPVEHNTDPVIVRIEVELNQIVNVVEKSESLSTFLFIRQFWNDPGLTWNPMDYHNLTRINISPKKIWLPDIVLENNVEKAHSFGGSLDTLKNRVIVSNNGNITWLTPALLTSKCPMNIKYFPFDRQVCELVFVSWTHTGNQIDVRVTEKGLSIDSYSNHSEWALESVSSYRREVFYSCCPDTPYHVLHFQMILKRKPLFYLLNLILPIVVISMLAMLTFYLPAESGERISFGVTIFLSLTVFMLIVDELIPATSDSVPLVTIFFTSIILEMMAMLIVMCYILKLYLKSPDDEPMPKWVRRHIYENLAYKLGFRKSPYQKTNAARSVTNVRPFEKNNGGLQLEDNDYAKKQSDWQYLSKEMQHMNNGVITNRNHGSRVIDESADRKRTFAINSTLLKKIDSILQRFEREDQEKSKLNEWRICAMTIDRTSFLFFSLLFVATSLGCFLSAP